MRPILRRVIGSGVTAIAALVMAGLAGAANEDVHLTFKMEYYDVSGTTWHDIWSSIKANLQKEKDLQGKYEGITSYSVKLEPKALVENNTCSSDTTTIAVNLVVKVPKLTTSHLGPNDQECWAFYDRSLSDHEEWHVQIAVHEMQALQAKVRSSPGMNCGAIIELVNRGVQKMLDDENNYDDVTSHGLEQWRGYGLDKPKESAYVAAVRNRCFG